MTLLTYTNFNNKLADEIGLRYTHTGDMYFKDESDFWTFIFIGSIVFLSLILLFQKPKE